DVEDATPGISHTTAELSVLATHEPCAAKIEIESSMDSEHFAPKSHVRAKRQHAHFLRFSAMVIRPDDTVDELIGPTVAIPSWFRTAPHGDDPAAKADAVGVRDGRAP